MRGGGRGAVPNGHDGAPPGGCRSEISTSISQESQEITQGRAHALLQLPGVGCVESTPNPEAVTCQEGPGGAPPVGRGLRALSSDSPRRCREAGEAPSGCVGLGRASRRQQNNPESLSRSGGPPSGMQIPGSTAAGQTLQEMTRNPPVHCAFPMTWARPGLPTG